MISWIKKVFGVKNEQSVDMGEVVQVPPHFHIDRNMGQAQIPDFTNFEKIDIAVWARENHNIKLDRRKSKNSMIEELKTQLKEK